MVFEEFVERVRVGVIAGVFTIQAAVKYLTDHGWHTTRDVPENMREKMLKDLTE